jgi:hypothetical protein
MFMAMFVALHLWLLATAALRWQEGHYGSALLRLAALAYLLLRIDTAFW